MRQASIAMSCVAEAKAVSKAKAPMAASPPAVPTAAMPRRPMVTRIWHSSIQPRRRPRRPSSGTSMRSTSGDQYTLKA